MRTPACRDLPPLPKLRPHPWRTRLSAGALGLATLLSGITPQPLRAQQRPPIATTVVSIGDGGTLRVRQGERAITVRLACIDSPEMAQSPWGERSRAWLRARLPIGSPVKLHVQTIDRYGRSVAEVIGEINVGLAMVEDGQA